MTILFWNFPCPGGIEKRAVALSALARMVRFHQVDILALAETKKEESGLISEVLAGGSTAVYERADDPVGVHPNIQFFTRFPAKGLVPFRSDDRLDVRRLRLEGRREILIAAIHFYDRRNFTPEEQSAKAVAVNQTLRGAEVRREHTRTVLFGDLNMNPFEPGMVNSAGGFASLPSRVLASRHSSDDFRERQRFYNPAWSRLGREEPDAPGTYYYGNVAKPLNLFWHHLDQVLIRPALLDSFRDEDFQVLTSVPGEDGEPIALIRSTGKHWTLKYSDHLPILFKLDPPKDPAHA